MHHGSLGPRWTLHIGESQQIHSSQLSSHLSTLNRHKIDIARVGMCTRTLKPYASSVSGDAKQGWIRYGTRRLYEKPTSRTKKKHAHARHMPHANMNGSSWIMAGIMRGVLDLHRLACRGGHPCPTTERLLIDSLAMPEAAVTMKHRKVQWGAHAEYARRVHTPIARTSSFWGGGACGLITTPWGCPRDCFLPWRCPASSSASHPSSAT